MMSLLNLSTVTDWLGEGRLGGNLPVSNGNVIFLVPLVYFSSTSIF